MYLMGVYAKIISKILKADTIMLHCEVMQGAKIGVLEPVRLPTI